MSGALVTAGLYPIHTASSGNNPPSKLAHSDTRGSETATTRPTIGDMPSHTSAKLNTDEQGQRGNNQGRAI